MGNRGVKIFNNLWVVVMFNIEYINRHTIFHKRSYDTNIPAERSKNVTSQHNFCFVFKQTTSTKRVHFARVPTKQDDKTI